MFTENEESIFAENGAINGQASTVETLELNEDDLMTGAE